MREGRLDLILRGISIDWDAVDEESYVREIEALSGLTSLDFRSPVTFFVGENGSGKSTLLEAIAVACGFNPEGGTRNYSFATRNSHSDLYQAVRPIRSGKLLRHGYFLRAESFYNVATAEEQYGSGPGGAPQYLHERSHGESFLAVAQQHFRGSGLYFLDEPEAALSPQRQLTLLIEIARCVKEGGQFLIASHSPILLGMPDAQILTFDEGTIHPCAYEETDSYKVTSMFLSSRDLLFQHLFSEDAGEEQEDF